MQPAPAGFSSKTPGRTRLINMFGLPDPLDPEGHIGFLVDLPGYGYASVARNEKESGPTSWAVICATGNRWPASCC